jgi:hypothetical protein
VAKGAAAHARGVAGPRAELRTVAEGTRSTETVTHAVFDDVLAELKSLYRATEKKGDFRKAASLSGRDNNEWSFLFEFWGAVAPSFDFHIRVVD